VIRRQLPTEIPVGSIWVHARVVRQGWTVAGVLDAEFFPVIYRRPFWTLTLPPHPGGELQPWEVVPS